MKLYEILNEKYLGTKFKIVKDGIESEWIREVAVNNNGKYGYVMDHSGIWNLSEGNLLCDIELLETKEEKYKKFIKNELKITKDIIDPRDYIIIAANYDSLKSFREEDNVIFIEVNKECIVLSFDEFDLIIEYVKKLRKFKNK